MALSKAGICGSAFKSALVSSKFSVTLSLRSKQIFHRPVRTELRPLGFITKVTNTGKPFRSAFCSKAVSTDLGGIDGGSKGGDGAGGGGDGGDEGSSDDSPENKSIGFILLKGWRERVAADPEFVFKVATEQVIGVSACVIGDMSSRPNFGLNELDFVFCTLVVGSIVNFALMYLLAPTSSAGNVAKLLPGVFAGSPPGHMFEIGSYTLPQRFGTFLYKGVQFAAVGFFAGLAGTAVSNGLLTVRQKLDPSFVVQNEQPPTVLNAATWALHMGISSNLRYQSLNGLDQTLVKVLSPSAFVAYSFAIRAFNNVIGGSTFAILAKATGSQKAGGKPIETVGAE